MEESARRRRSTRYEAALWVVMGVLAFLAKDNPHLVFPQALYLFLALMASSLGASFAVRLAPERRELQALAMVAGFASIAGIQEMSGGAESSLWVLYLLPLFTAGILLDGRAIAWTTFGACAANAALYAVALDAWSPAATFELTLKTSVLAGASGAVYLLSCSERDAEARLRHQREEIQRLEESVLRGTEERERGLAEIAAGGAGAAHDLGSPLMVVRAYARMHLERGLEPELQRDLERIDAAAAFCQSLAAELLSRAKGEAAPRRLAGIVDSALSLAEQVLRERRVTVERDLGDGGLEVLASRQDVERILMNLVANAARAMRDGGHVRVAARREETDGPPCAVVTVEDDGPGLPADLLPRLFQPFVTTRAGKGGTGLGLYLSREAARRLGGELEAGNREAGGARFTLRLPLRGAAVAA